MKHIKASAFKKYVKQGLTQKGLHVATKKIVAKKVADKKAVKLAKKMGVPVPKKHIKKAAAKKANHKKLAAKRAFKKALVVKAPVHVTAKVNAKKINKTEKAKKFIKKHAAKVISKVHTLKAHLKKATGKVGNFFAMIKSSADKAGKAAAKRTMKITAKLIGRSNKGRKLTATAQAAESKKQSEMVNLQCKAQDWLARIATYANKVGTNVSTKATQAVDELKKQSETIKNELSNKFNKNTKSTIEKAVSMAKKAETKLGSTLNSLSSAAAFKWIRTKIDGQLDKIQAKVDQGDSVCKQKFNDLKDKVKYIFENTKCSFAEKFVKAQEFIKESQALYTEVEAKMTEKFEKFKTGLVNNQVQIEDFKKKFLDGLNTANAELKKNMQTSLEQYKLLVGGAVKNVKELTTKQRLEIEAALKDVAKNMKACVQSKSAEWNTKAEKLSKEAHDKYDQYKAKLEEMTSKLGEGQQVVMEEYTKTVEKIEKILTA